jgi:hypothetical protein
MPANAVAFHMKLNNIPLIGLRICSSLKHPYISRWKFFRKQSVVSGDVQFDRELGKGFNSLSFLEMRYSL